MANQAKIGETAFKVGDTIKVFYRLIEKEKKAGIKKREEHEEVRERLQPFEGVVISISPTAFTVRRLAADNIGVERIFPLASPWISKITVKKRGGVRRAKLYYLRTKEKQTKSVS
jgi:large subunit ribosomal protein L19